MQHHIFVLNVRRREIPSAHSQWASTLYAAKQYYDTAPLAGGMLALTAVWLTVAGALVADPWRVNNEVKAEPLYPYKRKGRASQTRLSFEE